MIRNMNCASTFVATVHRGMQAVGAALCLLCINFPASAQEAHIVTFDAPGAGTSGGQGTFVSGINEFGGIAGYYVDANNVSHSFLRDASGKITTFDPPGTANVFYPGFNGSGAFALNAEGAVGGYFVDANFSVHAYLRAPGGRFMNFDWPGACKESQNVGCHGSGVWNINALFVAVGPYEDTSGNFSAHCAIRLPNGKITTFTVPGSSMQAGQGTLPASFSGLNNWGAITGLYYDANNGFHGYLRTPDGTFTDFEAPGADITIQFNGTFPSSINDLGAITGDDLDVNEVYHGWVRNPKGEFTVFDASDADTTPGSYGGTFPQTINRFGSISGYYRDANNVYYGFVRDANGTFQNFQAPGADTTSGSYNGTLASGMNDAGAITGVYYDAQSVAHGFLLIPKE